MPCRWGYRRVRIPWTCRPVLIIYLNWIKLHVLLYFSVRLVKFSKRHAPSCWFLTCHKYRVVWTLINELLLSSSLTEYFQLWFHLADEQDRAFKTIFKFQIVNFSFRPKPSSRDFPIWWSEGFVGRFKIRTTVSRNRNNIITKYSRAPRQIQRNPRNASLYHRRAIGSPAVYQHHSTHFARSVKNSKLPWRYQDIRSF